MRIPRSRFPEAASIQVIRYGGPPADSSSTRWTAAFEMGKRSSTRRVNVSSFSEAEPQDEVVEKGGKASETCVIVPSRISRRSKARGWKRLTVERDGEVWNGLAAWLVWVCGNSTEDSPSILVYTQPDTASFMAILPDDTPWQDLALLGTHDSCAFFGYPYAQCQQPATSITQQLLDGVRFLDLRMRVIDDELIMYHGIRPQRAHFTTVLSDIHAFLSSHPSETILVSIKEEVPPLHPDFAALVWTALAPHVDHFWFLETRLSTLGEVRGKALIMPRFTIPDPQSGMWDKGVGLKLDSWPDDRPEGFELDCGEDRVRVQDWYGVPSFLRIPEKLQMIKDHLTPTLTKTSFAAMRSDGVRGASVQPIEKRPLTISYLSAATIPLAPPFALAKGLGWPSIGLGVEGLNSRFTRWLLELMCDGYTIRGVVPVDFYSEVADIAGLLVVMNQLGLDEGVRVERDVRNRRGSGETLVPPSAII